MIGVDTNVLVRYLAQDDPRQSARATRLIEAELTASSPGFVGLVVLVETSWVLARLYRATAEEVRTTVADLLAARQLVVEQRAIVTGALARSRDQDCSFADALIVQSAVAAGCVRIASFDRGAARAGMTLLQ